jgi:hypothetical protein
MIIKRENLIWQNLRLNFLIKVYIHNLLIKIRWIIFLLMIFFRWKGDK